MKKTETTAMIARKELIASIAKRHAAEREFMKSAEVKTSTNTSSEYENVITEEFQALLKASINSANF
jgi:hypothetical protein